MKKTNAIRVLETNNIKFNTYEYQLSEEIDAVSVASKIKVDPEQVFKTLVAVGSNKDHYVFVLPGNYELNLKKAAIAADVKRIELIKMKDLLNLTGYIRGGCSPIGMKKLFPTFIDDSAQIFDNIYVSGGKIGIQIFINPYDLARITKGEFIGLI